GVHLVPPGEAQEVAARMIGETLVTKQTGDEGKVVRKVMVAEAVEIAHEYYLAILMDRGGSCP
ncbi:MAG: succinate--CoA ligase subunit beta, partial [Akkermansiaceae bacterium]|nr:succinate--CoA ligase subunit beta [Akkermansiaceae bacterium]